ncbi:MAG: N-acetyl-gamma-glutamyl-phosphate reductase [Microthrixaceae bacterium]
MADIGIIGASGFTGAELLRICAGHPDLNIRFATGDSQAGNDIGDLYPSLAAAYPSQQFAAWEPSLLDGVDGVFLGLPHGASQSLMPEVLASGVKVVDLGADFRLADPASYEQWYGEEHTCPELLDRFVYGVPELHREAIEATEAVANPGCYPTAASLAMAPFVKAGLLDTGAVVVNAVSGVSGAGRPPKPNTTFCAVDEDVSAYGLLSHRHTAEMEMNLGATVLFTPHLVPMNRGILATCTAAPADDAASVDTASLLATMGDFYEGEPFVVVSERSPSTKATLGTNAIHMTARWDPRTGSILAIAAIDNLGKGASSAAVQNMNLLLGLDEATGLTTAGLYP